MLIGWIGLNLMYLVLLGRLVRLLVKDMVMKLSMMLLLDYYLLFFQEVEMGNFVAVAAADADAVDGEDADGGGDDGGGDHLLPP
ncbi:hypothetical protein L195_g028791 [Trifolium pratense]|uniref:Uncharacterized protein n=1 Tax=Trifolium pratense TaxID=57577 RepID=A0A2K3L2Y8_TRIPR|nr:hypothetical protein L195_g028791 [Trifolium pratense]